MTYVSKTQESAWEIILHYSLERAESGQLRRVTKHLWRLATLFNSPERIPTLNIAVVGDYRSGKSTLVGRLLMETGAVKTSQIHAVKTQLSVSEPTTEFYRCLVDREKGEKESGYTQNISRTHLPLQTKVLNFINTPGKRKLIKNRTCGVSQADVALLVVDSDVQVDPTLLDLLKVLKSLGMKSLLVAITKFDKVQEDELSRYNTVVDAIQDLTRKIYPGEHQYVPVSAKLGTNITAQSPKFDWYTGPSLAEALEALPLPVRECNKPLRITIDKAFNLSGLGTVITGTIVQGVVSSGQWVKVGPVNKIVRIRSLQLAIPKTSVSVGYPGEYIALNVSGIHKSECACRRLGLITGFLNSREKERFQNDDPDVSNAPLKPLSPWSFTQALHPTTQEERRLAEHRQKESPLHPCLAFRAFVKFWGLPKGWDVSSNRRQQMTMHCHNSQVQVELMKCKRVPTTHKRLAAATSDEEFLLQFQETENSLFRILPAEVIFYLFQTLPQSFVYSVLPQLNKSFLRLSTHRTYWYTTNERDKVERLPIDPRLVWVNSSLSEKTQESLLEKGQQVLAELRPVGRPVGVDTIFSCERLGRFLLRIGNTVVGSGMVLQTTLSCIKQEGYYTF